MAVTWHKLRLGTSGTYKCVIQRRPSYRCSTREALSLCSRTVSQAVHSISVSPEISFHILQVRKVNLKGLFLMFSCPYYVLFVMQNSRNPLSYFMGYIYKGTAAGCLLFSVQWNLGHYSVFDKTQLFNSVPTWKISKRLPKFLND